MYKQITRLKTAFKTTQEMTPILGYISTIPALMMTALKARSTYIPIELIYNFTLNLGQLSKLYSNNIKYKDSNNLFVLKLDIFHNCCRQAYLSYNPKIYTLALSIILKDEAQKYYYI
jgi:hypothetical protein